MTTASTIAGQDDKVVATDTATEIKEPETFEDVFDALVTPASEEDTKDGQASSEAADAAKDDGAAEGSDAPEDGKSGADKAGGGGSDADASGDAAGDKKDEPAADTKTSAAEDPKDVEIRLLREQLAARAGSPIADDTAKDTKGEPEEPTFDSAYAFTDEEKTFLADYEKEWGDVSKGESIKRKAEYVNLVNHIFKQVHAYVEPRLRQALQTSEQFAETNALGIIHKTHSDYDDAMHDAVTAWANGLTGFRKRAALDTIESGEPDDVVDLLTEYKQATGKAQPKVVVDNSKTTTNGKSTPAATKTPLSSAAKAAAAAIAAPVAKRSATGVAQADPDDFDGAWGEAIGAK